MISEIIFTVCTKNGEHEFYVYNGEGVEEALKLITKYPEVKKLKLDTVEEYVACVSNLREVLNNVSKNKIEVSLEER